jgi:hypothetical protein
VVWGLGGDRGTRTPDLCDANAALSQLSYIPVLTEILYHILAAYKETIGYNAGASGLWAGYTVSGLTFDFFNLVAHFPGRHVDLYGIAIAPPQESFS